jgi:hypothetical protein
LHALDLATGTGANVRYLADEDKVDGPQHWTMVDHDQALLDRVPVRMSAWAAARGGVLVQEHAGLRLLRSGRPDSTFMPLHAELRTLDHQELFAGCDLVSASALLDLVSESWLRRLAERCRVAGAAVLFALTYDGRLECSPAEPEDGLVRDLVNRHQRTDKGFGPALGPAAVDCCEQVLAALGYRVETDHSDWLLLPVMSELQRHLIDGWTEAAIGIAPDQAAVLQQWRTRRLEHVEGHRSELTVGHRDLAASLESAWQVGFR